MTAIAEQCHERRKPIYLLADSQLLFWKHPAATPFVQTMLQYLPASARAAYIGASNGDVPEFYAIFLAAMSQIGITACSHIRVALPADEASFLATADLILLAGGDPATGLRALRNNGVAALVRERYEAGCLLVGISAGAMQLGRYVLEERDDAAAELLPGLELIPYLLDAHQQANDWHRLRCTVQTLEGAISGLGIPAGGGLLVHPDGTLEPVRHTTHGFSMVNGELRQHVLLPAE